MRREAALGLALSLSVLAATCGRSGATSGSSECTQFQGQELNATTRDCVGPLVALDGLNLCHDPTEAQGHGLFPVCVVSADGRLFKGNLSSTQWLEGTGWTHSNTPADTSTLSLSDEARCSAALSQLPACQ